MAPGIFGLFSRASSKKKSNLIVVTPDCTLECTVYNRTKGKDLYDQVIHTTEIGNPEFFDIKYQRSIGEFEWLEPDKLLSEQKLKKEDSRELELEVKFYPEDAFTEVMEDVTLKMMFEYVKQKIVSGRMECSLSTAIQLASYAVQAKLGDFDVNADDPTYQYLKGEYWISRSLMESKKNKYSKLQLRQHIANMHRRYKGQPKTYAMRRYLKLAQTLDMYGMEFYKAQLIKLDDARYENAGLGVTPWGIRVFKSQDIPSNPVNSVAWGCIGGFTPSSNFTRIKFQLRDSSVKLFEVSVKRGKQLHSMCTGYKELYEKRRRPSLKRFSPSLKGKEEKKIKHEKDDTKQKILVDQAAMRMRIEAMELQMQVMQKLLKAHEGELTKLSRSSRRSSDLENLLRRFDSSSTITSSAVTVQQVQNIPRGLAFSDGEGSARFKQLQKVAEESNMKSFRCLNPNHPIQNRGDETFTDFGEHADVEKQPDGRCNRSTPLAVPPLNESMRSQAKSWEGQSLIKLHSEHSEPINF